MSKIKTISPIDSSICYESNMHNQKDIEQAILLADKAQKDWANKSIADRAIAVRAMVDSMVEQKSSIAKDITIQMGRPISQSQGEVGGFAERANHMIDTAKEALKPKHLPKSGFERSIEKVPLGVVSVLSPWNYPLLTSVNAIVPALMAGNCVILKHSGQTPAIADYYSKAAKKAGLPKGVFQHLHLSRDDSATLIQSSSIKGVFFTGSVAGGKAIQKAIVDKFIPCGLELGGKDAAYVHADADINFSVENLVDGAFFNSGQSCCSIERIYVHQSIYDEFTKKFTALTRQYKLGNPMDESTNLGPMVKTSAANFVREQIKEAINLGATAHIDESDFAFSKTGTPYLAPQVLTGVDHTMQIMTEESFGPVVGIMPVENELQAVSLMNDSNYGLTASIWSHDLNFAKALAKEIESGTIFLNRCDYLDPELAWTGYKDSGRGATLSLFGYDHVTKLKSYHFRKPE